MEPSHLDKWLFKASFQEVRNFSSKVAPLEDTHPFKGWTILSLPLFMWILWNSLIIWNFKKFEVFIVLPLFLSHSPWITRLYHFLSSTHQSTTFPSPSLFYFLSTTYTLHFSIPPSHSSPLSLFPSFLFIPFSLFSQSKKQSRRRFRIFS